MPDHQEVYVDRDSDMSLIVELLSYDEAVSNEQAAAHYYNDLAQCNEVCSNNVCIITLVRKSTILPTDVPLFMLSLPIDRQEQVAA